MWKLRLSSELSCDRGFIFSLTSSRLNYIQQPNVWCPQAWLTKDIYLYIKTPQASINKLSIITFSAWGCVSASPITSRFAFALRCQSVRARQANTGGRAEETNHAVRRAALHQRRQSVPAVAQQAGCDVSVLQRRCQSAPPPLSPLTCITAGRLGHKQRFPLTLALIGKFHSC